MPFLDQPLDLERDTPLNIDATNWIEPLPALSSETVRTVCIWDRSAFQDADIARIAFTEPRSSRCL